jgi:mevalonate kinase
MVAVNPQTPKIVEEIERVVEKVRVGLEKGEDIGSLLDTNGKLLEEMGVVGEKVKELSEELRGMGYFVKITGAGGIKTGSGMMIVMGDDFATIKKSLDNRQINYFETTIGAK